MHYVIGIDVGTGSVRGALVDQTGYVKKIEVLHIKTWNPKPDFYQQSSTEIWQTCCRVVKSLIADIRAENVKGIGFDATCSLAVFDAKGNPLSVNENDENEQNIILWMDHRARKEAEIINRTKHPVLKYVGGNVSLEMMVPKILWLKRNHPKCWNDAQHYFLLPDFLTWKCTGAETRSLCSLVCKCNYEASPSGHSGWNGEFFKAIGLEKLSENNWRKLGSNVINPGDLCGKLTPTAAAELGLPTGVPVAASLIDAHAGGLGVMGCTAQNVSPEFETRLALISGTSTCHMLQTYEELYVSGVWGPYYNAMIPGMWLLEGGQSATGKLLDHVIDTHPAKNSLQAKLDNMHITEYLNCLLCRMATEKQITVDELTQEMHVWPDFHGNRSPIADSTLRGMILGLSLATDEESLAVLYLATIQALTYGTKHILDKIEESAGRKFLQSILICGGLSKNSIFVRAHANAIGLPVLVPEQEESVLLGAAELGATVAGFYPSLQEAVLRMAGTAKRIEPDSAVLKYHSKKYAVFHEMLIHQNKCRQIMNE